jgi:hypothetical protein
MEGLAAVSAGVTNTYGNGGSNTVKHYYERGNSKSKAKKKEGKKNGK